MIAVVAAVFYVNALPAADTLPPTDGIKIAAYFGDPIPVVNHRTTIVVEVNNNTGKAIDLRSGFQLVRDLGHVTPPATTAPKSDVIEEAKAGDNPMYLRIRVRGHTPWPIGNASMKEEDRIITVKSGDVGFIKLNLPIHSFSVGQCQVVISLIQGEKVIAQTAEQEIDCLGAPPATRPDPVVGQ
jgi:hypothetical protein